MFSDKTRYDGGLSFSSSNNSTFSIDNNSISGNFAKFTGNVPKGTTKIWAVYPAGNASSCETDGTNMKVTLPTVQNAVAKTFDNNLNISVAKAEVSNTDSRNEFDPQTTSVPVNFENVCSFLKFTTPGTDNTQNADISKVILSSNTAIAGSLVIDPATPKVTSSSSTSITMSGPFKQNTEYWFVIAKSGDVLNGLSLTVVTTSEDVYCWAISGQTTLKVGQYRTIGKISLNENHKITLSAQHTYDASGYLTGTDVSVKCGTTVLTPSTYSIKNGGTEKRNQGTTNYPYLPKGTGYTYEGTVTWNQVNVAIPQMSFVVPAPSIGVSKFAPFTSYSKYLDGKSSVANSLDGSTIYANVTVSIASGILNNTNYKSIIKVNDDDFNPISVDGVSCVSLGSTSWESHEVSQIKWIFDGVTASHTLTAAKTVHVTGIPYDYSFTNKSLDAIKKDSWTPNGDADIFDLNILGQSLYKGLVLSSRTKEGGFMGIGGKEVKKNGYMVSRPFYIPANTDLQASVSTTGYVAVGTSRTVNGYLGAVGSSTIKCDTSKSFKTTCTNTTSTGESGWYSVQFQSSINRLCIASEQVTDNNGSIYHFLNEAHLHYAE